jgi:aryl-alcohol dehydrogenase-like predicted oxidoreductase
VGARSGEGLAEVGTASSPSASAWVATAVLKRASVLGPRGAVQIIFNMFRLKPAEAFFPAARARQVGILARVPLASGLLTGKLRADPAPRPRELVGDERRGGARRGSVRREPASRARRSVVLE